MRTMIKTLLVLAASLLGVSTAAADFDGSKALMCSFAKVIECPAGFQVPYGLQTTASTRPIS